MEVNKNETEWIPFSLTFVAYRAGDHLGQCLAIASLTPLVLLVSLATLCAFRRDLHTLSLFAGQVLNEALNWSVKHWTKEPRPQSAPLGAHFGRYGFPSSHTQFMWFFASYVALFLFIRIYLGHHSLRQVWWGAVIGGSFGVSWFIVVHCFLTPLFPWIVSWPLSEYLLIRDFTPIPNIIFFEYRWCRSEARARSRKYSIKHRHQQ